MKFKAITGITLTLLLVSILTVSSRVTLTVGESFSSTEHDIAVVGVTPSKTVVGQQFSMNIIVIVENQGGFSETFNVTSYYGNETLTPEQWETFWGMGDANRDGYIDDIDVNLVLDAYGSISGDPNWNPDCDFDQDGYVGTVDCSIVAGYYGRDIWSHWSILGGSMGRQTVNDLSAANSTTLVFTWNTTGVPYGNYIISARATRVTGETDITNNAYDDGWVIVTIPGDVDGDGYCGSTDWSRLAGAYGCSYVQPSYDPEVDIDGDGYVGSSDFSILAGNYGKEHLTNTSVINQARWSKYHACTFFLFLLFV